MRTKMKVLSALIGLASIGATVAQAQVYSLNVVGYVNYTCPPGFSIIANPLVASNATVATALVGAPPGTRVFKFNGSGYVTTTYQYDDDGNLFWDQPDMTLQPGEGFFLNNAASTNYNITWVGEVAQGTLTNVIPVGFSLRSSKVPQSAQLDTVLGFTPNPGDRIYLFRNGGYVTSTYMYDDDGNLVWDMAPVPNVGEGFFIKTTTGQDWVRTFNVQ